MTLYIAKVLITAIVVVAVVELTKRGSSLGAVLASLPSTALLAFVWIYLDTGNVRVVAILATHIFWLIIASMPLFLLLPLLLRIGWSFWPSLGVACGATVTAYLAILMVLHRVAVRP
jgi:hypothetical protein